MEKEKLIKYITHLADNNVILGQRLAEWCGHGPILEQDIALSNISLDLFGQARMYYQYAAELLGEGHTEDTVAYLRTEREYLNVLLVEQPNGDFGDTMARQFIYDSCHYFFLKELQKSKDERLSAIAEKSIKEVAYHKRFSSEWVIRLGDGTEESHRRMQNAIDRIWKYKEELVSPVDYEKEAISSGVAPNPDNFKSSVDDFRNEVVLQSTLTIPEIPYFQFGGKEGSHTEYLGHLLTDFQYMQRTYPGLNW